MAGLDFMLQTYPHPLSFTSNHSSPPFTNPVQRLIPLRKIKNYRDKDSLTHDGSWKKTASELFHWLLRNSTRTLLSYLHPFRMSLRNANAFLNFCSRVYFLLPASLTVEYIGRARTIFDTISNAIGKVSNLYNVI